MYHPMEERNRTFFPVKKEKKGERGRGDRSGSP